MIAQIGIVLNPILDLADGLRPVLATIFSRQEELVAGKADDVILEICDVINENEASRKLVVGYLSTILAQVEWTNTPAEEADFNLILRQQRQALEVLFKNKFVLRQLVKHVLISGRGAFKLLDKSDEPKDSDELNAMLRGLISMFRPDKTQAAAA